MTATVVTTSAALSKKKKSDFLFNLPSAMASVDLVLEVLVAATFHSFISHALICSQTFAWALHCEPSSRLPWCPFPCRSASRYWAHHSGSPSRLPWDPNCSCWQPSSLPWPNHPAIIKTSITSSAAIWKPWGTRSTLFTHTLSVVSRHCISMFIHVGVCMSHTTQRSDFLFLLLLLLLRIVLAIMVLTYTQFVSIAPYV